MIEAHTSQSSQILDSSPQIYPQAMVQQHEHSFQFPASPHLPPLPEMPQNDFPINAKTRDAGQTMNYQFAANTGVVGSQPNEMDAHYWRSIFRDLGFGAETDPSAGVTQPSYSNIRTATYPDNHQGLSGHPIPYHTMPTAPPSGYAQ